MGSHAYSGVSIFIYARPFPLTYQNVTMALYRSVPAAMYTSRPRGKEWAPAMDLSRTLTMALSCAPATMLLTVEPPG